MMAPTVEELYRQESDRARAIAKRMEELADELNEEAEKLHKALNNMDEGVTDDGGQEPN